MIENKNGKKGGKKLSIVIPCYNEEKGMRLLYGALNDQAENFVVRGYDYEYIFVNDGSRDQTLDFILEFADRDPHVKYISFSRNFGKEAAMLAGLEFAKGCCAVIMDADLQHPPSLIPQMLDKYEKGYDQVIARRNRDGEPWKSAFFAKTYYKLTNKLVDVKLVDGAGDFRLLNRKSIDAVLSLKETNRFSKGIFSWVGFRQTYIEYDNKKRFLDESHWSFRRLLGYGVDGIVSFNVQPLRMCVYLGGILLAISIVYLLYLFIRILIYGIDVPGYFTTITLISVLGGVQLISLGIIGEYVGRIYAEVKKRPLYIVDRTNIKAEEDEVGESMEPDAEEEEKKHGHGESFR